MIIEMLENSILSVPGKYQAETTWVSVEFGCIAKV